MGSPKRMELPNNRPKESTMNATWIITAFVVIDDLMMALGHRTHPLAQASDAEVLTVAIVAAKYFQSHYERNTLNTRTNQIVEKCTIHV